MTGLTTVELQSKLSELEVALAELETKISLACEQEDFEQADSLQQEIEATEILFAKCKLELSNRADTHADEKGDEEMSELNIQATQEGDVPLEQLQEGVTECDRESVEETESGQGEPAAESTPITTFSAMLGISPPQNAPTEPEQEQATESY